MFRSRPSPGDVSLSFRPLSPRQLSKGMDPREPGRAFQTEVAYGGLYASRQSCRRRTTFQRFGGDGRRTANISSGEPTQEERR